MPCNSSYQRPYLGALCRLVADLLRSAFATLAPRGQPAFILYVQTFGDLVTFNPHIHALVTDGVFLPSGTFRVLMTYLKATLPGVAAAAEEFLSAGPLTWDNRCDPLLGMHINAFKPLITRLDEKAVPSHRRRLCRRTMDKIV